MPQAVEGPAANGEGGGDETGAEENATRISSFQLDSLYEGCQTHHLALPQTDQPSSLKCELRPYQKQALYWMSRRETRGEESGEAKTKQRHPLWDE